MMAMQKKAAHRGSGAKDGQGGGEYSLNNNGGSSGNGQEWILDAYRSLEPAVSFGKYGGENEYEVKYIMCTIFETHDL